ncbi:MAG: DUF4398 domain-containing protein [Spirochaetaceae bacterium]|jgi:hypothetical protein|nr:DUF4398 domain-containing protein [Spirochaetaceae bacterium]
MWKRRYDVITLVVLFCVLVGLTFALQSCSKPPTAEMDAARAALANAENDPDAASYSANAIARAKDLLAQMEAASQAGNYDSAKSLAAEVVSAANKAIEDAKTAAAQAQNDAQTAINAAKTLMNETTASLENAKGAKLKLDFAGLEGEMTQAQSTIDLSQTDYNNGRYNDAKQKAENARSAIASVQSRVAEGAQVVNRKK